MEGWVKIHRCLLEWEWYSDANTFRLFIHLIIKANSKDAFWRGEAIKRGQIISSIAHLSEELRLSPKQIRISLDKLKRTNEITTERANNSTRITICKYDNYQSKPDMQGQTKGQVKGQMKGKEGANEGQTEGNKQEFKEERRSKEFKEERTDQSTFQTFLKTENIFNSETFEFLSSEMWFETKAMQLRSDIPVLMKKAKEFLIDIRDRDLIDGKNLFNLQSHFVSWFKKKREDESFSKSENFVKPTLTPIE